MKANIVKIIPITCILLLIISALLPPDLLRNVSNITPISVVAIFICPIMSIIGIILSIIQKKKLYILVNAVFIFSFPIMMLIGNVINAI